MAKLGFANLAMEKTYCNLTVLQLHLSHDTFQPPEHWKEEEGFLGFLAKQNYDMLDHVAPLVSDCDFGP